MIPMAQYEMLLMPLRVCQKIDSSFMSELFTVIYFIVAIIDPTETISVFLEAAKQFYQKQK